MENYFRGDEMMTPENALEYITEIIKCMEIQYTISDMTELGFNVKKNNDNT